MSQAPVAEARGTTGHAPGAEVVVLFAKCLSEEFSQCRELFDITVHNVSHGPRQDLDRLLCHKGLEHMLEVTLDRITTSSV
jgi:hypothetical protein